MDDAGQLAIMPSVFDALGRIDPRRAASYAPIAGDVPFLDAVKFDVFGSGPIAPCTRVVATAGGTGALHHAIVNFLEPGQALYTTSYFWGPYATIAKHTSRAVETFEMFDEEGRFAIEAFERGLNALVERQGRALVILNFPCHNPTGYSLDEGEWKAVTDALNKVGAKAPVALLIDLAYARYGAAGSERWVEWIEPVLESCTLLVAWSASKGFAQYGSRVGALLAAARNEDELTDIANALAFSCRGTWSNCNHLGILAVTRLLTDDTLRARADAGRAQLKALLDERVAVFNREALRAGLRYPRYEGGFFVSVFADDAARTAAAAREEGVFVVPMNGAVRVALCATPKAEVPRLVATLARATRSR